MVACFFGHRDTSSTVKADLLECIENLITEGADSFLVGNQGAFDVLVLSSLRTVKERHGLVDAYGKKIVPHGLRHNFATVGIRAGMDIVSLALMMRHTSRVMTLDTYGDANADALTLASVKLKDTFNENTDYFRLEEEQDEHEE